MVVLIPGMGDDIQAIKAGILEISDLYESEVASSDEVHGLPVNTGLVIHSERGSALGRVTGDGADKLVRELNMMLDLDSNMSDWRPPIQKVIASQGEGIEELIGYIEKHYAYIQGNGLLAERRTKRIRDEMLDILSSNIGRYIKGKIVDSGRLDGYVESIQKHETDPYTVVGDIMKEMLK